MTARMCLHDFHNLLRILTSIDAWELESGGVIAPGDTRAWDAFNADPFRWFIRSDGDRMRKLWTLIERRHEPMFAVLPPSER